MKTKLFFVIAFILFVQIANAQRLGIKGGVNFANVNITGGGGSVSPTGMTGFHLGLVADFKLQEKLNFNTGLLYSLKGTQSYNPQVSGSGKTNNYLEIPFNVAYKFSINETSDYFIQAGTYLAYEVTLFGGKMKRFDYGLGFGAGVQFGSIVASLNYELGLANLGDYQTAKVKNKVFQISLAYMFGSKK